MGNDEPLDGWLLSGIWGQDNQKIDEHQARMHRDLEQLADHLDNPPAGKKLDFYRSAMLDFAGMIGVAAADVPRAEDLYLRVVASGGTGSQYVQEELLNLLSGAEDERTVPFWVGLIDLKRPRDRFAARRRTRALASLARLAIHRNVPAAYAALRGLAHHPGEQVRAEAIYYWSLAYEAAERLLPPDVVADLTGIATQDGAFAPRFRARDALSASDEAVPLDHAGGVYEFKVTLTWAREFYCTIAARSEDNLDTLHALIQDAFEWDSDHLYAFYMNGVVWDDLYRFSCPMEGDNPPFTDEAILGELGLVPKHKFLYLFDYGDGHEFEVQVAAIRLQPEPGEYPRILERSGKPPEQYRGLDDDDDVDDSDDFDEWYGEEGDATG
jgi:hypothetical protein